jgi:hypothetical protein
VFATVVLTGLAVWRRTRLLPLPSLPSSSCLSSPLFTASLNDFVHYTERFGTAFAVYCFSNILDLGIYNTIASVTHTTFRPFKRVPKCSLLIVPMHMQRSSGSARPRILARAHVRRWSRVELCRCKHSQPASYGSVQRAVDCCRMASVASQRRSWGWRPIRFSREKAICCAWS